MSNTQDLLKRERKLAALRTRDLTAMGYEARARHSRQLEEAEAECVRAREAEEESAVLVGHAAD